MERQFESELREEPTAESPTEGAIVEVKGESFKEAEELSVQKERVAESRTLPRAIKSEEIWEADLTEDPDTSNRLTEEPEEGESPSADFWEVEDPDEYDESLEEFFDFSGEFHWLEKEEQFEEEKTDYVLPKTTSRIAGRIVQYYEERQPGEIVDEEIRFCIGRNCERVLAPTLLAGQGQKTPQIPIIDGTFIARDGKRVLLEVDDDLSKSAGNRTAHLNAIRGAIRHCQQQPNRQECLRRLASQIAQTRSIFLEVAPRSGRNPRASSASAQVRAITRVEYTLDPSTGKLATRSQSLDTRNLTIQQMLADNVLGGKLGRASQYGTQVPPLLPRSSRREQRLVPTRGNRAVHQKHTKALADFDPFADILTELYLDQY